jgi:hypothetical protein
MAALGPIGQALGAGLGVMTKLGAAATVIGSDMTNQEGVGNNSYYPDYTDRSRRDASRANREQQGETDNDDTVADNPTPTPPPPSAAPTPPTASPLSTSGASEGVAAAGSSDAAVAAAAI